MLIILTHQQQTSHLQHIPEVTVVFSRNSIGAGLSYSRLYSDFESVNRYNVVNNQVGTPTLVSDKDPFNINPSTASNAKDVETNDKIAIFLFNGSTFS